MPREPRTPAPAAPGPGPRLNLVVLAGVLARPARQRVLPSGDHLVEYEVTVARGEGRAETVPVVWPGAPASALDVAAGAPMVVLGRVRRRFFRAAGATASRTEVVAEQVAAAGQRRRVRGVLLAAEARLAEVAAR